MIHFMYSRFYLLNIRKECTAMADKSNSDFHHDYPNGYEKSGTVYDGNNLQFDMILVMMTIAIASLMAVTLLVDSIKASK